MKLATITAALLLLVRATCAQDVLGRPGVVDNPALPDSADSRPTSAQTADGAAVRTMVTAAFTVTNKGISTVPSITLGRPAAIADLSIRRGGLSFDPQFRVGLNGKPWSFLFWGRFRFKAGERLRVTVGAHPALSFRTTRAMVNGVSRDVITARRYLAGEVAPDYAVSEHVSVGAYYLYSQGLEDDAPRHNHFVAARAGLSDLRLSDRYVARFNPQVYYLRVDDRDGVYLYSAVSLAKRDFPVSLSAIVNQPVRTNVPGGEDFLWNVSLTYALH